MSRAGSALPRPTVIERNALARGQLRGLGQRLALGGLAVGEDHDRRRRRAAQLGQAPGGPRRPVATVAPTGSIARTSSTAGRTIGRPIDLGQQPGRVRDEIEPDLVLLFQLAEQPGLVLQDQALGDVEPGGLRFRRRRGAIWPFASGLEAAASVVERGLDLGLFVLVGDALARRIVDQDRQVGQPGPLDREDRLGEHEHGQEHQRDPQAGQEDLGSPSTPCPRGGRARRSRPRSQAP